MPPTRREEYHFFMRFTFSRSILALFIVGALLPVVTSAQYYNLLGSPTDAFGKKDGPLQIVLPNGGEYLVEGNTYTITWTGEDLRGSVDLYLINDTKRIATITIGVPVEQNSYNWKVPKGFAAMYHNSDFGMFAFVRVHIVHPSTKEYDTSDSVFTIEASAKPLTASRFKDVSASHENATAIEFVRSQGMVGGYDDGTFRPNATINRAEFVKILTLYKFEQEMVDMCGTGYLFTDVRGGEWFQKYVCRARDANLISGYPDGSFKPERMINFVEAAKIIATTDTYNSGDPVMPQFTGGPWYSVYVQYLSDHDAIPMSIVSPDQLITRGEMAEIIYLLKAKPGKPSRSAQEILAFSEPANVCTDDPIDSRIGGGTVSYPKKKEYAHLDYLGEVLTAHECGAERFQKAFDDEKTVVGPHPFIDLYAQPSSALRKLLTEQGYACYIEELFHCTKWEHPSSVRISAFIKLRPYILELSGFSCPNCYR